MTANAGSVSADPAVALFKKVYGKQHDLVPNDQLIEKDIPWQESMMVGDEFIEDVVLGCEVGITLGGSGQEVVEINSAIAGAVKQTKVKPYMSILPSVVPFTTISRSAGAGEKAFFQATKFVTKNNLKSHNKFLEIFRIYGQSAEKLGRVSYYTGTYRGAAFTTGTGTLNGITFTTGVNTTSKNILFKPGTFAAGHWVGMKGVKVKQIDSSDNVVASGKLTAVNAKYGYITVDFVPVVASSETSHRLCFDGMESLKEMIGIQKILTTNGTLFDINNAQFELFRGNSVSNGGKKLSLPKLQEFIADAVNGGGLEGDVTVYVNPRTWTSLSNTEAGQRVYDQSYKSSTATNGFMDIEYFTQTGRLTIKAHRLMKEGDAAVLMLDTWKRSGSAQVGFRVPGMDAGEGDLIRALENQTGYQFKSYADEYIFCHAPAQNIWITDINDEAAA
jgi:hypothetical protein